MFVTKIQSYKDKIFKACPNLEFFPWVIEFFSWVLSFLVLEFFSKCRKKEADLTLQFTKNVNISSNS